MTMTTLLDIWIGLLVVPAYKLVQYLGLASQYWLVTLAILVGVAAALYGMARVSGSASGVVRWFWATLGRLVLVAVLIWFVTYGTLTAVLAFQRAPLAEWMGGGLVGGLAALVVVGGAVVWLIVAVRTVGVAFRTAWAIVAPANWSRNRGPSLENTDGRR
jgi:hypothetical protein